MMQQITALPYYADQYLQCVEMPYGNEAFSKVIKDLHVSDIKQKTFVEVNEEGTEAAAVTVIGITGESIGVSGPISFFANHPFLYLIKEKSTGAILFIGRMDDPIE